MSPSSPTREQQAAIARTAGHFRRQDGVRALLLAGSLAHGFATPASDVDVLIVVSDEELAARATGGRTTFWSPDLAGYPGGYVDGKYVSPGVMAAVARRGSEPARFAYQDARVLFCHEPSLPPLLAEIPRYPAEGRTERIARFHAQLEAWTWYAAEAERHGDPYLLATSVARATLFAGRMVLAHNQRLYPFHKWFLRALEDAPARPPELVERIRALARSPSARDLAALVAELRAFRTWETGDLPWPVRFIQDSELAWLDGRTPVEDL